MKSEKAKGGNLGLLGKVAIRRRDVGDNTAKSSVQTSAKSISPSSIRTICQHGQCRQLALRPAFHVVRQGGQAIPICRRCFTQIALSEAAAGVRRQFNALFVRLRPSSDL